MHFPSIIEAELRLGAKRTALDLACGSGRHSVWLWERGWAVTAVDQAPGKMPSSIRVETADLTKEDFEIGLSCWDLIVCWLYWQPSLLPAIAAGLRSGGIAALAGKTSGRFATCLSHYRTSFPGWQEISAGEEEDRAWFIARKPLS